VCGDCEEAWGGGVALINNSTCQFNRHTVSLLTDHIVFSPKYRGKVLVGDVDFKSKGNLKIIRQD
jgi:hypothetical protein